MSSVTCSPRIGCWIGSSPYPSLPSHHSPFLDLHVLCVLLAEAERLRGVHRDLTGEVTALETKQRDLEKSITTDYGPNMAFESLRHHCVDFTPEGAPFTYEMYPPPIHTLPGAADAMPAWPACTAPDELPDRGRCPFKDARQKPTSVSVGSWVGFGEGGHTEMKFSNGTVRTADFSQPQAARFPSSTVHQRHLWQLSGSSFTSLHARASCC